MPVLQPPKLDAATGKALFNAANQIAKLEPWADFSGHTLIALHDQESQKTHVVQFYDDDDDSSGVLFFLADEGTRYIAPTIYGLPCDKVQGTYNNRMLSIDVIPTRSPNFEPYDLTLQKTHLPKKNHLGKGYGLAFRSLRPGEAALQVNQDEAKLLTRFAPALAYLVKHADQVFELFKKDEGIPTVSIDRAGQVTSLKNARFPDPGPAPLPDATLDDLTRARFGQLKRKKKTVWETGAVFLDLLKEIEGRPSHQTISLCIELSSKKCSKPVVGPAREGRHLQMVRSVVDLAETLGYLPEKILCGHPVAFNSLRELTKSHGIEIASIDQPGAQFEAHLRREMGAIMSTAEPQENKASVKNEKEDLAALLAQMLGQGGKDQPDAKSILEALFKERIRQQRSGGQAKTTGYEAGEFPEYRRPVSKESYVFRVDLNGMKPPIWRRITLPTDATFFDLHRVIQAAFHWSGYHLHHFEVRHLPGYDILSWRGDQAESFGFRIESAEADVTLADVFGDPKARVTYHYDFGDDWRHSVKLEKTIATPAAPGGEPFQVLKGKGAVLESVGGPWGLGEIIAGDIPPHLDLPPEVLADVVSGFFDPEDVHWCSVDDEMDRLDEMNE